MTIEQSMIQGGTARAAALIVDEERQDTMTAQIIEGEEDL